MIAGVLTLASSAAHAQVELKTYADKNGNIDVQKLTCAIGWRLQEDAGFMTVWHSGWYNGLAGFNKMKIDRAKESSSFWLGGDDCDAPAVQVGPRLRSERDCPMILLPSAFHVLAKPTGATCNLDCKNLSKL